MPSKNTKEVLAKNVRNQKYNLYKKEKLYEDYVR